MSMQGLALGVARAELRSMNVSVAGLLRGDLRVETQSCSLSAEAPAVSIDQGQECLTYLGLNRG